MLRRRWIAGLAAVCATFVVGGGVASADTGDTIAPQHNPPTAEDGWQAGTCTMDLPECSPNTKNQFFTQAAGHPPIGLTQFTVANKPVKLGPIELGTETTATLKDIRVDLPVGLSVNPQATAGQCTMAQFTSSTCPLDSVVGQSGVTVELAGVVAPPLAPLTLVPVYNIVPETGEPALFGFSAAGATALLKSDVEWDGDYHEGFTIAVPKSPLGSILKNRLVFTGTAGNGTFLTNPSTCHNPAEAAFAHTYSTFLRADSLENPNGSFPNGSTRFEAALPPGVKPDGCASVPFKPGVNTAPGINQTDTPSGAQVEVTVPFDTNAAIANSNVQTAKTSLPVGMGLNPSAADGLVFCDDGQLGKGTRNKVSLPGEIENRDG